MAPLDEPLFWFVDFAREKKEVGGRLASSYILRSRDGRTRGSRARKPSYHLYVELSSRYFSVGIGRYLSVILSIFGIVDTKKYVFTVR